MSSNLDASLAADLWFFRIAAEVENIGMAADILAVTQSAVTQRIQRLEGRLNSRLFERSKRGVKLTPAGQQIYEACRSGFNMIEAVLRANSAPSQKVTLRVNCIPSLALEWLAPRVTRFTEKYPDIDVSIFAEMNNLDRRRMLAEQVDVAIRYGPSAPKDAQIAFDLPEPVYPVAAQDYIQRIELADDLSPIVLLHDASPWADATAATIEWSLWCREFGTPWGRPTRDQLFNLAQMAYQSAMSGTGIALGRSLIVGPHIASGRLAIAVPEAALSGMRYYVLNAPLKSGAATQIFIDWLHQEMITSREN